VGKQRTIPDPRGRRFGRFVLQLRKARSLTQETLAERSGLASDTIRRMEHGDFSPSLFTLGKLVDGLDLDLSTLFTAFELAELDLEREILLMVRRRLTPDEIAVAPGLLTYLAELISAIAVANDASEGEDA